MRGSGNYIARSGVSMTAALAIAFAIGAFGPNAWGYSTDDLANLKLAYKLLALSQSPQMKADKYTESQGGSKSYNNNDGNSFLANTTYHSYVWDYCKQWVGLTRCNEWIPPYVSLHGEKSDRSPLEGVVWQNFQARKGPPAQGDGGTAQYGIWDFQTKGALLDQQGKLNQKNILDWKIQTPVAQQIAKVGEQTAQDEITATLDDGTGNDPASMTNEESLRMMASRWTRMFRNRLVSNLGEQRVADKGIEFGLGENRPSCGSYLDDVRDLQQRAAIEERIKPQAQLDIETRMKSLEQRYDLCMKMQQQPNQMVNPIVSGDQIVPGSAQDELAAKWKSRVNIATVDSPGLDPNQVAHPNNVPIQKQDYATKVTSFTYGGQKTGLVAMTNNDQIRTYNQNLEASAKAYDQVAKYVPVRGTGQGILANKIPENGAAPMNLVQLNGLTNEMKENLAPTGFPRTAPQTAQAQNPETQLEPNRAGLLVQRLQ